MESARSDEMEGQSRSPALQQVREQMVTEADDPADQVLRDRIIQELIEYLEGQDLDRLPAKPGCDPDGADQQAGNRHEATRRPL